MMAVTAKAFQLWRSQIAPDDTVTDLCRVAGIKRSTLAQQLVRGKVSVSTIVAIARAYGLPPVDSLAVFEGYRDLADGIRTPTDAEFVSQVSHIDILRLLVARSEERECVGTDLQLDLAPFPHRNSVRAWIEAIDPGDLRQQLAASTGVARQNLSAQLTAGRLAPEIAVEAARIAGVSLTSGLVVTGVLAPQEGGWPDDGRARALCALSDLELVILARDRLDVLGKQIRRAELDDGKDRAMWENLG
ncbi:helix-turn-helix domain-containing protein [Arthrobacter sp. TMS1-12-1]